MRNAREVTTITLSGGQTIPASAAICPQCGTLDLPTDFEPITQGAWRATCPMGHQWPVVAATTGD